MYRHLEFSASGSSGLFESTNLCRLQKIQRKYPEFSFPKYFTSFGALHIVIKSLIANRHLVVGTGLDEILGDTSIETAGLQTLTVDVNHIHKARYCVQLPFVSIYTCLKEAIFVGGRTFFI